LPASFRLKFGIQRTRPRIELRNQHSKLGFDGPGVPYLTAYQRTRFDARDDPAHAPQQRFVIVNLRGDHDQRLMLAIKVSNILLTAVMT
jgi:hypothetical protein